MADIFVIMEYPIWPYNFTIWSTLGRPESGDQKVHGMKRGKKVSSWCETRQTMNV